MLLLAAYKSRFTVHFSVSTYLSFLPALTFSLLIAYLHYSAAYTVADRLFPAAQCTRAHIRSLIHPTFHSSALPQNTYTFAYCPQHCSSRPNPPQPTVGFTRLHSHAGYHGLWNSVTCTSELSIILQLLITYLISHKNNLYSLMTLFKQNLLYITRFSRLQNLQSFICNRGWVF